MTRRSPGAGRAAPGLKSRSGTRVSYAERKLAGWTLVRAELDERTLGRLDEMCRAKGGLSRAEMIRTIIDATWAEMREAGELEG